MQKNATLWAVIFVTGFLVLFLTNVVQETYRNYTIETLNGKKVNLYKLRNESYLIHFWATWCIPCREELPKILAFRERLKEKDIPLYLVAVNDSKDKIEQFFNNAPPEILLDNSGRIAAIYGVEKLPETIFVSKGNKKIHWKGPATWEEKEFQLILKATN